MAASLVPPCCEQLEPRMFLDAIPLVNAGFETGDFTGWDQIGGGMAVNGTYGPPEGSYKAELQTDNSIISQTTGHTIAAGEEYTLTWEAKNQWNGDGNYARIYYVDGGSKITIGELDAGNPSVWGPTHTLTVNADDVATSYGFLLGIEFAPPNDGGGTQGWIGIDDINLSYVSPPNALPTAVDDVDSTTEDSTVTTADLVAANDSDPDSGDTLTVTSIDVTGTTGQVTDHGDGTFTYDPNGQFEYLAVSESTTDSFDYTISDGNGGTSTATVTITINGVNDNPLIDEVVIFDDNFDDTAYYQEWSGRIRETELDAGVAVGDWTISSGAAWNNQLLKESGDKYLYLAGNTADDYVDAELAAAGELWDGVTITFLFATKPDQIGDPPSGPLIAGYDTDGNDLFEIRVGQNGNEADSGYAFPNQRVGDIYTSDTDLAVDNIHFGESNEWIPIQLTLSESTYDLWVDADQDGFQDTGETVASIAYTNTPTADFGKLRFNTNGGLHHHVDDLLVVDSIVHTDSTTEDSTVTTADLIAAYGSDSDVSDTLTVDSIDTSSTTGQVTDHGDGTFTYDPNGQFEYLAVGESTTDSFDYTISDGNGGSSTATITITINGANDVPSAVDDSETTDEDSSVTTIDLVAANDSDIDTTDVLNVSSIDTSSTTGQVTNNGDGTFTYDPNGQFEYLAVGESTTDSFDYTISDGNGGSSTATITITINGANDVPSAVDDSETTDEDSSVTTIDLVAANDSDIDTTDVLNVSSIDTSSTTGQVTNNGDGTFSYDPNGQFEALNDGESTTDTFTYTISDGNGGTHTATVTITVDGVTDPVFIASPPAPVVGVVFTPLTVPPPPEESFREPLEIEKSNSIDSLETSINLLDDVGDNTIMAHDWETEEIQMTGPGDAGEKFNKDPGKSIETRIGKKKAVVEEDDPLKAGAAGVVGGTSEESGSSEEGTTGEEKPVEPEDGSGTGDHPVDQPEDEATDAR